MIFFISLIVTFANSHCQAQQKYFNISGTVVDAKDRSPMPGATVYLSNTTIGTVTTETGAFVLNNIPSGNYKLIASFLGYKTLSVAITGRDSSSVINLELQQHAGKLKAVTVKAKRRKDKNRRTYFEYFKKGFLGTDANSNNCEIINPQVIYYNFDEQSKILSADVYEPLIIENKALGYKIYYDLDSFTFDLRNYHTTYFGYPRFEKLQAKNIRQQNQWDNNRLETYWGSMRHFMLLLANRRLEQYNIEMNKLIRTEIKRQNRSSASVSFGMNADPLKDLGSRVKDSLFPQQTPYDSVIHIDAQTGIVKLRFNNSLRIRMPQYATLKRSMTVVTIHDNEKRKPDNVKTKQNTISIITMAKPGTNIDANGVLTDPLAITVEGSWANRQVADLLPFDYRP